MKYIIIILLGLFITGCSKNEPEKRTYVKLQNVLRVNGSLNNYEIIEIGPYKCVGMDGYDSGGIWCERINMRDVQ